MIADGHTHPGNRTPAARMATKRLLYKGYIGLRGRR